MDINKIFTGKKSREIENIINKLPYDTKKRIQEEIIQKELEINLHNEINDYFNKSNKGNRASRFKQSRISRREELKRKGVIKPIIRYNKELVRTRAEELSAKSKADFIKELELRRMKQKEGCTLDKKPFKLNKGDNKSGSIRYN